MRKPWLPLACTYPAVLGEEDGEEEGSSFGASVTTGAVDSVGVAVLMGAVVFVGCVVGILTFVFARQAQPIVIPRSMSASKPIIQRFMKYSFRFTTPIVCRRNFAHTEKSAETACKNWK